MTMTSDCRCSTIVLLAFLYLFNVAGLLVQGDNIGTQASQASSKINASNAKLSFLSTKESSEKLGVEPPIPWTRLGLNSSMFTPPRVLDEAVLQNNETWDAGTNASDSSQISLSSSSDNSWCIAKAKATPDDVQEALDWACGFGGADCEPIQLGNACFIPNTVFSHASYAFNSYYQIHQHAYDTCDFKGTATVVYEDPSYSGCSYPFRSGQPGAPLVSGNEASRSPLAFIKALIVMSILLPIWVL